MSDKERESFGPLASALCGTTEREARVVFDFLRGFVGHLKDVPGMYISDSERLAHGMYRRMCDAIRQSQEVTPVVSILQSRAGK